MHASLRGIDVRAAWSLFGHGGGPPPGGGGPYRTVYYGAVVLSVNVSVLVYEPVRRASVAPIACRNCTVTGSLETGAL